ncbi:(S)-mandelate dehydrogenase [Pseudoxanthobacter soli DSM 19599]|uniref:(S)-mandelate dehydrogenase n=1 Tax=Pseudoxanthobacter soli DSM 19599 TaxID=1123029 RepID=A0A1M7ZA83_9HYPH|nr:alpha-hydroxy acid oxidase [Pseudoxanthobacter soli]SHO61722.1 (S)-mandelate dehydrogenase [Pseudoxanthobacter soli DSM 19599]
MRRYYSGHDVERARSIEELRRMAMRRIPNFCREYLEGGAEDEVTLRRNRSVFEGWAFLPRTLVDVTRRVRSVDLFGQPIASPFLIGPTGFNGMLTRRGDLALARAAAAAGIPFTLSNVSNTALEDIADKAGGRLWMQVYLYRSRRFVHDIAKRAERAGFEALIVTTDLPAYGNREWDARNFRSGARLTLRNLIDTACHPRWLCDVFLPDGMPRFRNLGDLLPPGKDHAAGASAILARELDPSLNWQDIAWLRDLWPGKLIVKGILDPHDAEQARHFGVDGVILSNHGGRQLDGAISPMEILPDVAALLKGHVAVLIDGGFRRGSDIVKARALGADAVLLGRATLYGLAAGGEKGAARAIHLLTQEVDRVLALLGCTDIRNLGPEVLRPVFNSISGGQA